jgi:hypothetical protein
MARTKSENASHHKQADPYGNSIVTRQSKYTKKYQDDIVSFMAPEKPTREEENIIADIVSLDHRSVHSLKPNTSEREEVKRLIVNSVVCLQGNQIVASRSLLKKAETVYYNHLQAKNRIKYLLGMVIGIVVSSLIAIIIQLISSSTNSFIQGNQLTVLCLFAGMGSIASVLTRLSKINLKQETSNSMIMISGGTRPVVAILFAVVVYLILDMKILDIQFGSGTQGNRNEVYLVTSFLCGFSERFANDIISRVSFSKSSDAAAENNAE